MRDDDDPFDIENLRLAADKVRVPTPRKIAKRRQHFVVVPFNWAERLNGASGKVYSLVNRAGISGGSNS